MRRRLALAALPITPDRPAAPARCMSWRCAFAPHFGATGCLRTARTQAEHPRELGINFFPLLDQLFTAQCFRRWSSASPLNGEATIDIHVVA